MYASLEEMKMAMLKSIYCKSKYCHRVTKSYRKGRSCRVQNIYDKNGFTIKQIIHYM